MKKEEKKIQEIIEEALLGAIVDKYAHRVLNERDIAKEATEDIMDYLSETKSMNKRKIGLQDGIEIMLVGSQGNPDIKFVAKCMTKWIRKYFKEKSNKILK